MKPIIILPHTIQKYPLTNRQLGAVIRLQAIAHQNNDGALPLNADILSLSEWDGSLEEFEAVREQVIPHPDKPGHWTTINTIACAKNREKAAQKRQAIRENLLKGAKDEALAQARKELRMEAHRLREEQRVKRQPTPVRKIAKIGNFSF